MPKFHYQAKKGPRDIVEGTIDADNPDNALEKISQLGYFPIDIHETTELDAKPILQSSPTVEKVKRLEISIFTRQLADLLDSGLAIISAMTVLAKQTPNHVLQNIVVDIRDFIQDGGTLSDGLARHGSVFSNLYVSLVRSGEVSGGLEIVLNRLADFLDKQEETIGKIRNSLTYPFILIVAGAGTVFILLTFAVPRLVMMFDELSQALPLPTRILIFISDFFKNFWWLLIAVGVVSAVYVKQRIRTREGRSAFDAFKLRLPLVGDYIKKIEIARFARTLATLLDSGVAIEQSMRVVANVVDNVALRKDIEKLSEDLMGGSSVAHSLSQSKHFPEVAVNMISVGEEAAHLEKSLFKVADSFEREVDRKLKALTSWMEPVILLILGGVTLFIVLAMLLPILQMNLMTF
ncbi:type II secretion system F family protein [Candidatus Omnitrophota bacterium]